MDNRKELKEARGLFLLKLKLINANDITEVDHSEETFPYSKQVHGIVGDRLMIAFFTEDINGNSGITFTYKDDTSRDLTSKEFVRAIENIEVDKPERTLERFKLNPNEQLIVTHEMCKESETMCTFYELRDKN